MAAFAGPAIVSAGERSYRTCLTTLNRYGPVMTAASLQKAETILRDYAPAFPEACEKFPLDDQSGFNP
jgi:hypothetical protein